MGRHQQAPGDSPLPHGESGHSMRSCRLLSFHCNNKPSLSLSLSLSHTHTHTHTGQLAGGRWIALIPLPGWPQRYMCYWHEIQAVSRPGDLVNSCLLQECSHSPGAVQPGARCSWDTAAGPVCGRAGMTKACRISCYDRTLHVVEGSPLVPVDAFPNHHRPSNKRFALLNSVICKWLPWLSPDSDASISRQTLPSKLLALPCCCVKVVCSTLLLKLLALPCCGRSTLLLILLILPFC